MDMAQVGVFAQAFTLPSVICGELPQSFSGRMNSRNLLILSRGRLFHWMQMHITPVFSRHLYCLTCRSSREVSSMLEP